MKFHQHIIHLVKLGIISYIEIQDELLKYPYLQKQFSVAVSLNVLIVDD